MFDRKKHWEQIYQSKALEDLTWFQRTPEASLKFLRQLEVATTAKIIDIGGGDSLFVDHLLDQGFTDITVLDIAQSAIERAQKRLGKRAKSVKWIVADAADFTPPEQYDVWHDRAAFHFLTTDPEIASYLDAAQKGIQPDGLMIIGTFSEEGPEKCSGLAIRQYSEASLTTQLKPFFEKIRCTSVDHLTPFDTIQKFIFCSFRSV